MEKVVIAGWKSLYMLELQWIQIKISPIIWYNLANTMTYVFYLTLWTFI